MAKKKFKTNVPAEQIERSIHVVRGQRVMLDADLAQLYEVTTAALNQAVQRNAERFPEDFVRHAKVGDHRAAHPTGGFADAVRGDGENG